MNGVHLGCAYQVVADCRYGGGCRPAEQCPGGRLVHRTRWDGSGHHHRDQVPDDEFLERRGEQK